MAYDADECTQALPVVNALKRASLRESLACEANGRVSHTHEYNGIPIYRNPYVIELLCERYTMLA